MAGAAPTENPTQNLEYTADQDRKLHKGVADNSTKAGYSVTAADVNPEKDSHLYNIRDILGKTAVHVVNSAVGDEEGSTKNIEIVSGPKVVSFMEERAKRLFHMRKQQTKKAA